MKKKSWVKNLDSDKVEIMAEGEKEKLEELIKWCHAGSDLAKVKKVEVDWLPHKGEFEEFEIRY